MVCGTGTCLSFFFYITHVNQNWIIRKEIRQIYTDLEIQQIIWNLLVLILWAKERRTNKKSKLETWCERERAVGLSLSILWKVYELQLVAFILFALKELILETWNFEVLITWGIYILTINYFWHQWITLASRLLKHQDFLNNFLIDW